MKTRFVRQFVYSELQKKSINYKYPPVRYSLRSNKQEPPLLCEKLKFDINKKKGWWNNKNITK